MQRRACQAPVHPAPLRPPGSENAPGSGIVWVQRSKEPGLKPNYQYEKRQREMEKKKKKAEKALKKAAPTDTPPETGVTPPPADK